MISCAVTAQLICAFCFAYVDCWFSYAAAHYENAKSGKNSTMYAFYSLNVYMGHLCEAGKKIGAKILKSK